MMKKSTVLLALFLVIPRPALSQVNPNLLLGVPIDAGSQNGAGPVGPAGLLPADSPTGSRLGAVPSGSVVSFTNTSSVNSSAPLAANNPILANRMAGVGSASNDSLQVSGGLSPLGVGGLAPSGNGSSGTGGLSPLGNAPSGIGGLSPLGNASSSNGSSSGLSPVGLLPSSNGSSSATNGSSVVRGGLSPSAASGLLDLMGSSNASDDAGPPPSSGAGPGVPSGASAAIPSVLTGLYLGCDVPEIIKKAIKQIPEMMEVMRSIYQYFTLKSQQGS